MKRHKGNSILKALRKHGESRAIRAAHHASSKEGSECLHLEEVWGEARTLAFFIFGQMSLLRFIREGRFSHDHAGDSDVELFDWSRCGPDFVMEVAHHKHNYLDRVPAAKVARCWRGVNCPPLELPDVPQAFLDNSARLDTGLRAELLFRARVLRREKLFRIPLPPHLLLGMCDFL